MEWVVTTGRTVDEALEGALDQLGVDEQDAEVEVLQEAQKGLFGRIRVEAQVRARVRPSSPPPKVDRRDRRRGQRGREGERSPRGRSRAGAGARSGSGGHAGSGADDDAGVTAGNGSGGGRSEGAGAGSGTGQARKRRRRSGSGTGSKAEGARAVSESAAGTTTTGVAVAPSDIDAQRDAVDGFLRGLVDAFGRPDATVSVEVVDEDTLEAEVEGSELGLLVGQKGATLQSVQELVRSMVQRRFVGESHARVRLDVAGYRERRRVALERFTTKVAETVRESGTAKALDPMGAPDRKVVHDTVNDIEGVETVSEGEDAYRHVVIRPS